MGATARSQHPLAGPHAMFHTRLLLVLGLASGGISSSSEVKRPHFERILGGSYARANEFPFMLGLEDLSEQFCGAVAISSNWAITAAHCVHYENAPKRLFLRAGSLWRNSGGTVHEVVLAYIPTTYYEGENNDDIALLKVKRRFTQNKSVRYIHLPRKNEVFLENTNAVVIGWGSTDSDTRSSRKLKKAFIRILDERTCAASEMFSDYESHELTDGMMCATKYGRDSRSGDSGGPLIVKEGNRSVLAGIVSWGDGLGNPDWPGIYTKVSRYRTWIKTNTGV